MVSIIIVNYKNPPLLRLSLKSWQRVVPQSFNHELIVVDVSATLETENLVREEFPQVVYLPFKNNIGYTRGTNEGIKTSKGDAIFIANSDIIPEAGALERLHAYLNEHQDVGMIGPRLLNFDGSTQQSCFRFYTPFTVLYRRTFLGSLPLGRKKLDYFMLKDKDLNNTTDVGWVMGSAVMVSKKAVDKVGLLDENLFLYMSDVDWPLQFWKKGFRVVYNPQASMYHYHSRTSKGKSALFDLLFNKTTRWHIKDAFRYFRKNGTMEPYTI